MKIAQILFLSALLTTAATAQDQTQVMIDESFSGSEATNLVVNISDGDVAVSTAAGDAVRVAVSVTGNDMERAETYFDAQNFDVEISDGALRVTSKPEEGRNWDWRNMPAIWVDVTIPETYVVSVRTSDGDVAIDKLLADLHIKTGDGDIAVLHAETTELELQTSDGDIAVGYATGESIHTRTSDGDITLETVESKRSLFRTSDGDIAVGSLIGDVEAITSDGDIHFETIDSGTAVLRTSDGNIAVESATAQSATMRTSDGDIVVSAADARSLMLRTSDGDIVIESMVGNLAATTSDGSIVIKGMDTQSSIVRASDGDIVVSQLSGSLEASGGDADITLHLVDPESIKATTGSGNITLTLPSGLAADVLAAGDKVDVEALDNFEGDATPERVHGSINGGGAWIVATSAGGNVTLDNTRK